VIRKRPQAALQVDSRPAVPLIHPEPGNKVAPYFHMLAYFETAIGWPELLKRTYKDMIEDDAMGLAAQLAYFFFLALFPAILCVIALASFFPLQNFTDEMISALGRFAPDEMLVLIRDQMVRLGQGNDGGLFSIGLLGAIWSSSAALVAIISAMNKAYDIEESRPWWKVRLTAILLTIGLAVFIVFSFALIIGGPQVADWLANQYALGAAFAWTWKVLQWPIAFALVVTGISLVYYLAPDAEQEWVWIAPGSLVAATLWVLGSLAFRYYVVNFGGYETTYGAVAGVILLLLWFYLSGFVIILGAELSAEIEHASPWGKAPGEKVPGQRKTIGAAASREYHEHGALVPLPVTNPKLLLPSRVYRLEPTWLERLGAYALFVIHWRNRTKS
jgi:membrane protein